MLISCCGKALFRANTNELIYEQFDYRLNNPPREREKLEQYLGIKCDPEGLLADEHVRTFYKPVDHTLRDPQHTLVSNGVCQMECAEVINAITKHGISFNTLSTFACNFALAHRHGNVESTWLSQKRLGKKKEALQPLSSEMLSIMPTIATFLEYVIESDHPLHANLLCFQLLTNIAQVCFLGLDIAMNYINVLRGDD